MASGISWLGGDGCATIGGMNDHLLTYDEAEGFWRCSCDHRASDCPLTALVAAGIAFDAADRNGWTDEMSAAAEMVAEVLHPLAVVD